MPIPIRLQLWVVLCVSSAYIARCSDAGLLRREQLISRHDPDALAGRRAVRSEMLTELTSEGHIRMQTLLPLVGDEHEETDKLKSLYTQLANVLAQGANQRADPSESVGDVNTFLERTNLYAGWANAANPNIVCQTGFRKGHTALRLLSQTKATLYAFDLGEQTRAKAAAQFLRSSFPGRLNNIWGDSSKSLPAFSSQHPDVQCDLMIVDGGHDYPSAIRDLQNFAKLASSQHLLALGGAACDGARCKGSVQAWQELVSQGCIKQAEDPRSSGLGFMVGEYVPCQLWPQIGSQGYLLMEVESKADHLLSSRLWADHRHALDRHLSRKLALGDENLTLLTAELESVLASAKPSSLSELEASRMLSSPATTQQLKNLFGQLEHAIKNTKEVVEGHTDDSGALATQTNQYDKWATTFKLRTICETGFNAGHSALRFLAQSSAHLYEFDLGNHDYAKSAAQFLTGRFPGRLNITWGDSTKTLPDIHTKHPDLRCDLVIVDGGHDDNTAEMDLRNFAKLASKKHVLAIDDTPCVAGWCSGPTQAWRKLMAQGCIKQTSSTPMGPYRGFSTGYYAPCSLWPHFGADAPKAAASLADMAENIASPDDQLKLLFNQLGQALAIAGQPTTETHIDTLGELAKQATQYDELATKLHPKTVCESGFSGGHSALRFLAQSDATVYEFDLGVHSYAHIGAEFLTTHFPGRLKNIWGDSTVTLPDFVAKHPGVQCDLVIVDGGNEHSVVLSDLTNFAEITLRKHTLVVNNAPCRDSSCEGPTKAWAELVAQGCVVETSQVPMGTSRGFSTGRFAPCSRWPTFGQVRSKGIAARPRSDLRQFLLANQGRKASKEQLQVLFERLEQTISEAGHKITEGHADAIGEHIRQTNQYDAWANDTRFKTICETGFNAGHSALRFLAQTDAQVFEFDSGEHAYAHTAENFLTKLYPGRLVTVWGDSRQSVPNFHHGHQQLRCDLIIVDGGRQYDTVYEDLGNFAFMAHAKTVLAMDDAPCDASYCVGPTQAWKELIEDGCINELQSISMGSDRGFSIGHYSSCPLWPELF